MSREKSPRDLVWDQLAEHFGEPRTKTERNMFGRIAAELMETGATAEEVRIACVFVKSNFDNPSIFSVTKWFSISQRPGRLSPQQQALDDLRRNE